MEETVILPRAGCAIDGEHASAIPFGRGLLRNEFFRKIEVEV